MSAPQWPALTRRRFLGAVGMGAVAAVAAPLLAQQEEGTPNPQQAQQEGAGMDGSAYRPVQRPPKPGVGPSMTDDQRDALEHQIECPCPCTLDVYTCRTSMPCGYSPRLHADVKAMVAGGYSGDEILAAFVQEYGEKALMSPKKTGFNWVGYIMPFAAIGIGGGVLAGLIRRWGARAARTRPTTPFVAPRDVDASADELARLEAAVRDDG